MKKAVIFSLYMLILGLSACSQTYREELAQDIRDMDGYIHNAYEHNDDAQTIIVIEKEPEYIPPPPEPTPEMQTYTLGDRSWMFKEHNTSKP